jgi:GABA(A) receptor-associated protein
MSDFKKKFSFADRKKQTKTIIDKYENKCPIYLTYDKEIIIDKEIINKKQFNKYIVTSDINLGQFLLIVRKKININVNESLALFIEIYRNDKLTNTILAPTSCSIGEIYSINKDQDGFLYLNLIKENVFG